MKVLGALESAQIEWFLSSALPAASSYIYRVVYASDTKQILVSDGTTWRPTSLTSYTSGTLPAAASSNQYLVAFLTDTLQIKVSNGSVWTTVGARLDTYTSGTIPAAASNTNQIIWVSDLQQVQVSNGSAWVAVGSKAGTKNYFAVNNLNYDFETNSTTGWSLARSTLDATTKLPNQAAGSWASASANLSIAAIGSGNQLAGSYSLSLTQATAASVAGDMLVSSAITLDKEAQASIQTFSFFYKIASGATNVNLSGTSNNSLGVAVYVVDGASAGTWIQPAGVFNLVQNTLVGKCSGTFQVPSDATQVRLAVYFPNASTGIFSVYLDDFVLGPQTVQYGSPVTDWVTYTPTLTNITLGNGTVDGRYRRVGDTAFYQITLLVGSTTSFTASTVLAFNLFPGQLIDLSKVPGNASLAFGTATILRSATGRLTAAVVYNTTNSVAMFGPAGGTSGGVAVGGDTVRNNAPYAWSTGDTFSLEFAVPITGWSSSVSMSNDTDTRVVSSKAEYTAAALTVSTGIDTPITYGTLWFDTHGAMNISTGNYTVPVSGVYEVSSYAGFLSGTGTPASAFVIRVFIDNIFTQDLARTDAIAATYNASSVIVNGTSQFSLKAGQVVQLKAFQNTGANKTLSFNVLNIKRLTGPSVIAATETVACSYTSNAGQTISTGASQVIVYGTKVYDTHGMYNSSTGTGTIPVSGKYRLTAKLLYNVASWSTSQVSDITISKTTSTNTIAVLQRSEEIPTTVSRYLNLGGSYTGQFNAGDTFYILTGQNTGSNKTLLADPVQVYMMVERVGN